MSWLEQIFHPWYREIRFLPYSCTVTKKMNMETKDALHSQAKLYLIQKEARAPQANNYSPSYGLPNTCDHICFMRNLKLLNTCRRTSLLLSCPLCYVSSLTSSQSCTSYTFRLYAHAPRFLVFFSWLFCFAVSLICLFLCLSCVPVRPQL